VLFFYLICLSCSNVTNQSLQTVQNKEEIKSSESDEQESTRQEIYHDEIKEDKIEAKKRSGKLDIENAAVVGVNEDLLDNVTSMFKAIEEDDYLKYSEHLYNPSYEELSLTGPYILAINKIKTDETRLEAVIDEYSLNEIADEIVIVKITMLKSSSQMETIQSSINS